jgi:hypothetical protein
MNQDWAVDPKSLQLHTQAYKHLAYRRSGVHPEKAVLLFPGYNYHKGDANGEGRMAFDVEGGD